MYTGSGPRITVSWLPSVLRWSLVLTDTGTSARSSRPSVRIPRTASQSRSAPDTTVSTTSLTVPPSSSLTPCSPTAPGARPRTGGGDRSSTFSGVSGAGFSAAQTISPMPSAASRTRSSDGGRARRGGDRARRSSRPSCSTIPRAPGDDQVRAGRLRLRPPRLELGARRRPAARARARDRSRPSRDRRRISPSTSEWWVLKISAKRSPVRPSISQLSHSGFERSSGCESIRAASRNSCSSVPGAGQRRVADVVLDVEVRVVDPQRAAGLQRRRRQLLAVARHEVQPAADVVQELIEVRRRSFEQQHAADVHVRSRPS